MKSNELLKVGDRTYELLTFHRDDESIVNGEDVRQRGLILKANIGREDGEYILKNAPRSFFNRNTLVFPDWRHSSKVTNYCTFIYCLGWRWWKFWYWMGVCSDGGPAGFSRGCRLVRRLP